MGMAVMDQKKMWIEQEVMPKSRARIFWMDFQDHVARKVLVVCFW